MVNNMIGYVHIDIITKYISILKKGNHLEIDNVCNEIINNSYSILLFINQIYEYMINNSEFEKIMSKITPQILDIYGYLIKKADNYIQLLNISYIYLIIYNQ